MKTRFSFRLKLLFLFCALISFPFSQALSDDADQEAAALVQAGRRYQKKLMWDNSLSAFRKAIDKSPRSKHAQHAYIEIGKYYKYHRDWEKAIDQYHQAIDISEHSRPADDAKTAEAAVYYFRQDLSRALEIFQEVLRETKDWDQIKYCSYWAKEVKRKMSFEPAKSFSCGPKSLQIVLRILGIPASDQDISELCVYEKNNAVSIAELAKVASIKGLKPKVVKVAKDQLQNLNTPFIALVEPEHYVVVTDNKTTRIKYIDPVNKSDTQSSDLQEFNRQFKGYALIFLEDTKLAKLDLPEVSVKEAKAIKGGVCGCCPPTALGGPGYNPNVEFDGSGPCSSPGMPGWMVNTTNRNFIVQDMDFSYSSRGMPIEFIRTYNSDDPREGTFGRSWTFNYNINLVENPDVSIDIRRGDGRIDHFFWNGTRYQGPEGVYDALTKNANGTYALKIKHDKTTHNFDSEGKLTNIKDRNNNTISFTYDTEDKLTRITDPNSKYIAITYGANKKVSRITLADGRYASFTYDANNNLIQSVDMKQAASSFTYDSASYITAITTPHQGTTTIEYDTDGEGWEIKSITNALGAKRSYNAYPNNYQLRVIDSRGNTTLYQYIYEGVTESITSASGNKITFGYDDLLNRNRITDTLGNTANLTYDGNGNVISVTDPLGQQTLLTYDANDNLIQSKDPKGNLYTFTYDTKDNLISVKDPENKTTSLSHNTFGQLARLTDAKGAITDFSYDSFGNLVQQTQPLGKITAYVYDTLGRLTKLTDHKALVFSYVYDGVDHLTKVTYPNLTTANYAYNCCNLTGITDTKGALQFTYDAIGRMKSFTNYDNKVIAYDYDSEGNLITLTYPDNKKVNYEYDSDNRLVKVIDWLGNVTNYNYDSRGNLSFSASPGLLTVYKYDQAGHLAKLINYNANTMVVTSGFEYTLDPAANRSKIKRYLPLNVPIFPAASVSYAYNSDNQLTLATGSTFTYDNNGNLTKQVAGSTTTNLTYNYDNQLTRFSQGATALSYTYDALGNRINKAVGTIVTKYIVDPNRSLPSVLAETNSSGIVSAYYVYGLGLISKTVVGSSTFFYQYDGLGSTVALADKNGTVKNKYAYDDYGNLATNCTEAVANSFKYVGRYGVMTDLPDLLYMRARYYMPSLGRFINKDPIGLAGGMNMYGYVGGNPVNSIDPSGLKEWGVWWINIFIPGYGNYGGPFRTDLTFGATPIDSMDELFMGHDRGWGSVQCNSADKSVLNNLLALPLNPKKWNKKASNVVWATIYRGGAIIYFWSVTR